MTARSKAEELLSRLPFQGNTLRRANLASNSAVIPGIPPTPERPVAGVEEANIVTSEIDATRDFPEHLRAHRLVLDLDVPAYLVPSSTPGHSHLYLDVPMDWQKARAVLYALASAGVLEPGYVDASVARGYTAVRLPWVHKDEAVAQ